MALTAEQHSRIAAAYDKAAADQMVPAPQRAAFASKAEWFRLLAHIAAKKKAKALPKKSGPNFPRAFDRSLKVLWKQVGP